MAKHWTKGSKQVLLIYAFHNLEFADEHCESLTWVIAVVLKSGIIITNPHLPWT